MGGTAFPNHNTPRLSHAEYAELLQRTTALLTPFYAHIVCPPEAPSKPDHGDLDLLVSSPLFVFSPDDIQKALRAVTKIKGGVTTNFCVPLQSNSRQDADRFAQVDLHLVANPKMLPWELFTSSYGDMQQILGVLQRGLGLTANHKGLHVRIREIEKSNRKKAMLFLTKDIPEMLEFLGLDYKQYESGFASNKDVFAWCLAGRLWGEKLINDILEGRLQVKEEGEGLHAGDRQRLRKREMFRSFVEGYIPSHEELWKGKKGWDRQEVLEEALRLFDVRDKYDSMMSKFWKEEREKALMEEVRSVVPEEGERLGQVMKGFKRWVIWENGAPLLRDEECEIGDRPKWLVLVRDEEKENLLEWMKENYQVLLRREKERAKRMREVR